MQHCHALSPVFGRRFFKASIQFSQYFTFKNVPVTVRPPGTERISSDKASNLPKAQLHIPDSGYDSSRFVPMRPILKNRDGRNRIFRNPYDVPRRSYGISTTPLRFMTVLLRCYYDASTAESRHNRRTVVLHSW